MGFTYKKTDGNIYPFEFDDLFWLILNYKTYGLPSWFIDYVYHAIDI